VAVSLPPYSTEALLPSGFEINPRERDEHERSGAVVERIGRYDATPWVAGATHRRDLVRTTMDEV
jgi:hypothetical protein